MTLQVAVFLLLSNLKAGSSKGCFLGSASVEMADGTLKRLDQIQVGDTVLSWDEDNHKAVSSIVMHIPKFQRFRSEMVTVSLPHSQVHATEDHPFWSRGRNLLVSMHPNITAAEYGLQAEVMQVGEKLESATQQNIEVLSIARLARAYSADTVEVTTLCLQPFHWFYVHGVRVHNKGCFAPWVRVVMSDGSHKRISDVREQDRVLSWDSDRGQLSEATVEGLHFFPPRDLFQVSFDAAWNLSEVRASSVSDSPEELANVPSAGDPTLRGRLVMTADHPIYSSRVDDLVSMRPRQTQELYGLAAEQMQESEILRHHSGDDIGVSVQPWTGNDDIPFVMTLRLDRHHWFYAEGVRVHNKGGHFGGHFGGHYGGSRGFHVRSWTHSRAVNNRLFAAMVVLSARRRYGTWYNSEMDDCRVNGIYATMPPPATAGPTMMADGGPQPANKSQQPGKYLNGTMALDSLCIRTVGLYDRCSACNFCSNATCVDSIGGCDKFLSEVYSQCTRHPTTDWKNVYMFVIIFCGAACCLCFTKFYSSGPCSSGGAADEFDSRSQMRQKKARLSADKANQVGLPGQMTFTGTYTERGETKPTSYKLRIDNRGAFMGVGKDDDGTAEVDGVMRWMAGDSRGAIMWSEARVGVSMEVDGEIFRVSSGEVSITAKYVSSLGVVGKLNLKALDSESRESLPLLA